MQSSKFQSQLELLRCFTLSKSVIMCVSIIGIKCCSDDSKIVYMAHAVRKISYTTCDAVHKQIAFSAREPSRFGNLQYCHVLVVESSCGLYSTEPYQASSNQKTRSFISHTDNLSSNGNSSSVKTSDLSPLIPSVRKHSLRRSHEQYN